MNLCLQPLGLFTSHAAFLCNGTVSHGVPWIHLSILGQSAHGRSAAGYKQIPEAAGMIACMFAAWEGGVLSCTVAGENRG